MSGLDKNVCIKLNGIENLFTLLFYTYHVELVLVMLQDTLVSKNYAMKKNMEMT